MLRERQDNMEIDDYIAELPRHRRERLKAILDLIAGLYPEADASMKYKMPTYTLGDGWVAAASQKHYISVYTCGAHHLEAFKARHPGIKTGKGCINFKDSDEIPMADLKTVIQSAITSGLNH